MDRLHEAGLDVRVVVCDQSATNRSISSNLGISPDKPFFVHKTRKIYFMFDPPHLLKSLRNNLKMYNFRMGKDVVKWQYVEALFKFDMSQKIKLAPRLTEKHILLPCFSKMKVKLASQVFSHSVASAIDLLANLGKLPQEAGITAKFIAEINDLFDCFNSRYTDSVPLRRRMTGSSDHVRILNKTLTTLSELEILCGQGTRIHCVHGWQIAISALLGLWEDLRHEDVKFIMTRRLSQDRLENFFSLVRRGLGSADNPSCQKFRFAFKHAFVSGLLKPRGTNCEIDPDNFYGDICRLLNTSSSRTPVRAGSSSGLTGARKQITALDHSWALDLAVANGFTYISGYFARRMLVRCKCDVLEGLLTTKNVNLENETNQFLALKAFKSDKELGGLLAPGDAYYRTISDLETIFVSNITSLFHKPQVSSQLADICALLSPHTPFHEHDRCCGCFNTWQYFTRLFMTVRVRWEVREWNRRKFAGKTRCFKQNAKLRKLGQ